MNKISIANIKKPLISMTYNYGNINLWGIASSTLNRVHGVEFKHIFITLVWSYFYRNNKVSPYDLENINIWYNHSKLQKECYPNE